MEPEHWIDRPWLSKLNSLVLQRKLGIQQLSWYNIRIRLPDIVERVRLWVETLAADPDYDESVVLTVKWTFGATHYLGNAATWLANAELATIVRNNSDLVSFIVTDVEVVKLVTITFLCATRGCTFTIVTKRY